MTAKRKNYKELQNEGIQRLNIDVNSDLWHRVSVKAVEIKEEKKEFLAKALEERLGRLNNDIWEQLDNASGELYNAIEQLSKITNLPDEITRKIELIDISLIDSLKEDVEELLNK